MGVSVYYSGKLVKGTVDELVSYIEKISKEENLKTKKPEEFCNKGKFRFKIPQQVIDNPNAVYWAYPKHGTLERILMYSKEARLPTEGKSYEELCHALNSAEFTQAGIYLWVYNLAEPLRFIFVEGDTELTELHSNRLQSDRSLESIQYVSFNRESLATKTGYEHDPKAHERTLDILEEVNKLYFNGKMRINVPD